MSSRSQFTLPSFQRSVISTNYGKSVGKCGLKRYVSISLFINVDENATRVATTTVCRRAADASGALQPQMHNCSLAHYIHHDLMAIRTAVIMEDTKSHAYPVVL